MQEVRVCGKVASASMGGGDGADRSTEVYF